MSSDLITRRAAFGGLLALGGCGFTPVHQDSGALRGQVAFETPSNVAGFRLRGQLEQRLGVAQAPRYTLRVTLSASRSTAAVTTDGDIVRFNVVGAANWTLTEIGTDKLIVSGRSRSFTSYAATGSTVATQAAETDARARLSIILADMIVGRLLILSTDLPQ